MFVFLIRRSYQGKKEAVLILASIFSDGLQRSRLHATTQNLIAALILVQSSIL